MVGERRTFLKTVYQQRTVILLLFLIKNLEILHLKPILIGYIHIHRDVCGAKNTGNCVTGQCLIDLTGVEWNS